MNMYARMLVVALAAVLAGCASNPTEMKVGSTAAKTAATGSAGGATASNESSQLEKCDRSFGTVAIVEDQNASWYSVLTHDYRLGSTVPVLRLLVQQSNCFIVVERGRAMGNMAQERALQQSGEMRAGSNFGKGQIVAADYSITPSITFSARNTEGVRAAVGGFGGTLGALSAVAGGFSQNEASTMLLLTDNRSGVQVGAAEGSASKVDFNAAAVVFGSHGGGGMGGYTNTPQGKVIVAAFTDSYNQLVRAVRNYRPQTMGGQGLGTGGKLAVDGATRPAPPPPPPPPPSAGAPAATMSVADAQRKLASLGYQPGPPDGAMGGRTVTALKAFQKDRNLPITGRLDPATISALKAP
jgi:peptidoglycan hydrolase-like protein with peptidoglycan-binding domain